MAFSGGARPLSCSAPEAVDRTPGRRRRIVFAVLHSLQWAVTLAQYALIFSQVGLYQSAGPLRNDHPKLFMIILLMDIVRMNIGFVAAVSNGASHLYALTVMKRGQHIFRSSRASAYRRPSSHWTAAASRGIFSETCNSVVQSHNVIILLCILTIVATRLPSAIEMARNPELAAGNSAKYRDYLAEVCGDEMSTCRLGSILLSFSPSVSAGMFMTMNLMMILTPVRFWSPVALKAMDCTGATRLRRCVWHLPQACCAFFVWSVHLAVLSVSYFPYMLGGKAAYQYFFFSSCCLITAQVVALLYFSGCPSPLELLRRSSEVMVLPEDYEQDPAEDSKLQLGSNGPAQLLQPRFTTGSWIERARALFAESAGLRYRRDVLSIVSIYLFSQPVLSTSSSLSELIILWLLRAVVAAAWVLQSDRSVRFPALLRLGIGFGLVADARELRAALLQQQAWINRSKGHQHSCKEVRMYQASLLRMKETLAVSYRWQQDEVEVAPGVRINMSAWQMEALAEAIKTSQAQYVWLDKLSVPQEGHPLMKYTLLSRMMAVYSAASATLVLRTNEEEGSRYHQRGWTLQEYCASPRLLKRQQSSAVMSTPLLPLKIPQGLPSSFALNETELEMYEQARALYHTGCSGSRPFWLYQGLASGDQSEVLVNASYKKYKELTRALHTEKPEDKLRALYPLLMNIPVENQDELISLVHQVEVLVGEEDQGLHELKGNLTSGPTPSLRGIDLT